MKEEKNYWSDKEIERLRTLFNTYYINQAKIMEKESEWALRVNDDDNVFSKPHRVIEEIPDSVKDYVFIKQYLGNPEYLYNLTSVSFTQNIKDNCDPFLLPNLFNNVIENNDSTKPPKFLTHGEFKDKLDKTGNDVKYLPYYFYLNEKKTSNKLVHYAYENIDFKKNIIILLSIYINGYCQFYIGKDFVITYFRNNVNAYNHCINIYVKDIKKLPEDLKKILVFWSPKNLEGIPKISYLYTDEQNMLQTDDIDIKAIKFDTIKENYNDDIVKINDSVKSFMNDDTSGLVILHGIPGTGKTYYIRSLINSVPDKKFTYISESDFIKLCDNKKKLMKFGKDNVFIMEDCEMLLMKRSQNTHNQISDILNITDGMLGDSINLKIICTFNTNTYNIDDALLRNGRIRVNYEFKKLSLEKTKYLCKKHNTEFKNETLCLCDIYKNKKISNTDNKKQTKIGFK